MVSVVGVGNPHHTRSSSVQQKMSCVISAVKEVISCVCRSVKTVYVKQDSDTDSSENAFLGTVKRSGGSPWSITLSVDDKPIEFEIDTGAEVTVISTKAHREIGNPMLSASTKTLRGPDNNKLPVRGQFTATLGYEDKLVEQDLYVVDHLHKHLLGLPAI